MNGVRGWSKRKGTRRDSKKGWREDQSGYRSGRKEKGCKSEWREKERRHNSYAGVREERGKDRR